MDCLVSLSEGFSYDLWANRIWISSLVGFKSSDRPLEVLEHILQAHAVWLIACGVEVPEPSKDIPLETRLAESVETWLNLLKTRDVDETITYIRRDGRQYTHTLGQIASHVINHGTYHRGHLRGLAEADGFEDFPDTDLSKYLRELEAG